jgi:hypothetical protein
MDLPSHFAVIPCYWENFGSTSCAHVVRSSLDNPSIFVSDDPLSHKSLAARFCSAL